MWQLVINGPGYFDTAYELPEGTTHLGRADENDVVLSGDLVSRRHARLHVQGGALTLEDLGSRNGVRLNGASAAGSQALKAGDVVAVGENTLLVREGPRGELRETELVDTGGHGLVRRFGRGMDLGEAVVTARDLKEPGVLRALGQLSHLEAFGSSSAPPTALGPDDTDEGESGPEAERSRRDTDEHTPISLRSLALLYQVAETLARAVRLQDFLDRTCDLVMQRASATTGVVLLRHRSGVLVPAAVRHARKLGPGEVPVSDAVIDAALAQGKAMAVSDVLDDRRFAQRESVLLYGVDQVLCIPIGLEAPYLGVLYFNRDSALGETAEQLLDVCTAVAQLVQTGIQRFQVAPGRGHEERTRRALERFLGPEVLERRVAEVGQGGAALAQLDERQVTAVHLELDGLAEVAGTLAPGQLAALLGEFQRVCTQQLFSFEGTVTGFGAGQGRALFGAPYARGDDAIRAVRAALSLRAEWGRVLAARFQGLSLGVKAGLSSGKVLAGTAGAEERLEYCVLGEAPGQAALAAGLGAAGQVLVTSKTLAAIGARFDVRPLVERPLQGSRVRLPLFEVLEEDPDLGTLSGRV
jgi:adenylate cyclase